MFSQNARFSQIWCAPIQFNPALTGRFDGKIRFARLSSKQTSERPVSNQVNHENYTLDIKLGKYRSSGDERPSGKNVENYVSAKDPALSQFTPNKGYWSIGLNYYHYGSPTSCVDGKFYSGSIARHFYSLSSRYYGFGGQMTYAVGKLDASKGLIANYDIEINGGGFTLPKGKYLRDPRADGSVNYIDYNAGAYYGFNTEAVMFEVGYSMAHLFYPKNAFILDADMPSLRHRSCASSLIRVRLSKNFGLIQRNIYWKEGMYLKSTNENKDTTKQEPPFWAGLEFVKTNPNRDQNINFGLYFRSFRTIIPFVSVNINRAMNFRYSYETTVFSAKKYTSYTAKRHELAMVIVHKKYSTLGTKFYKKINLW